LHFLNHFFPPSLPSLPQEEISTRRLIVPRHSFQSIRVSEGGRKGGREGGREVEIDSFSLEALAERERRREELASLPTVVLGGREGGREGGRPAVRADTYSIYAYM